MLNKITRYNNLGSQVLLFNMEKCQLAQGQGDLQLG